jgi:predicted RNA-binding protein with PUA-like domain
MNYWLMKTEPETYSWSDLVKEKRDHWDGVRNYQARNFMKEIAKDDLILIYHSVKERKVVGVAKCVKEAYQDPTTDDDRWVAVDISPIQPLKKFVELKDIKSEESLLEIPLVKQSRLSVMPLPRKAFQKIIKMGGLTLNALS